MLRESVNRESTKQHLVFHGSSFGGLYKSSYVIIFTVFRNKNAKQTRCQHVCGEGVMFGVLVKFKLWSQWAEWEQ